MRTKFNMNFQLMNRIKTITLFLSVSILSCLFEVNNASRLKGEVSNSCKQDEYVCNNGIAEGGTIEKRFSCPKGFQRIDVDPSSFQGYLRNLNLKPKDSPVHYFDGTVKPNNYVYEAVVDLKIGKKNLHQCADAIMRLKAEYLWTTKQFDRIHFNLTNGFRVDYGEWMKGRRIIVDGNKTYWSNAQKKSNTYEDFWNYMELIFMYAGTASLERELNPVGIDAMQIGDVFIKGGYPGHAVIIVDMAVNYNTGQKVYMLAQSYMPAQELHVLKNPLQESQSPWYNLNHDKVYTPEWTFQINQLRRFSDN